MNAVLAYLRTLLVREPVLTLGLVPPLVTALLSFGLLHWTDQQAGAVTALVGALSAVLARSKVTPVDAPNLPPPGPHAG